MQKVDQGHDGGSPTGLRRLSPPESRLQAGSFGRPRAPGVRKLTDKVPIPCRMLWEPAPSGECRMEALLNAAYQKLGLPGSFGPFLRFSESNNDFC